MAIFLTIGLIQLISQPNSSAISLIVLFCRQMLIGAVIGYGGGKIILFLINHINLGHEGLYPVLLLSMVFLVFGLTDVMGGSGFLAAYLAGISLRQQDFLHQKSISRFYDGLAWVMQITMFLTLGLFVFPSRLVPIMGVGLLIAGCLIFIARPVSVLISLLPSKLNWREKTLISWVGLRGAAPIILATFPLLARLEQAHLLFNIVFFVVLTSVILQGTSIPFVAKWLKVDAPIVPKRQYPIESAPLDILRNELKELPIPAHSSINGKAIFELGLPDEFLVILIVRDNEFVLPKGGTVLQGDDVLFVLSNKKSFDEVIEKFHL